MKRSPKKPPKVIVQPLDPPAMMKLVEEAGGLNDRVQLINVLLEVLRGYMPRQQQQARRLLTW